MTKLDWPDVLPGMAASGHRSLTDQAHDSLFQAIVRGRIPPGVHLPEQPIASALGVSRISVREAIRQLEREGLIAIYPNRGAFTIDFTPADIEEIFSLRASLEALAIGLAAERRCGPDLARLDEIVDEMARVEGSDDRFAGAWIDARFHRALVEASGHRRALHAWHAMSAQITMAVYNSTTYYQDLGALADRHAAIVAVVRSGDSEAARECIAEHILEGGRLLLEALGRDRLLATRQPVPTEGSR